MGYSGPLEIPMVARMSALLLVSFAIGCSKDEPREPSQDAWTWSEPMALDETFTVPAGETLTIEAGVTVELGPEVDLVVEGELIARGTASEPITFTAASEASWGAIRFEPSATGAVFEQVDEYAGGSILEHAIVEEGVRAVTITGSSPYLHAVTFRNNTIETGLEVKGGAALSIHEGSRSRVRDCVFEDNTAELVAFGGGAFVYHADPIFQDNRFVGNWSAYGGGFTNDLMASPIVGNHFEGNESYTEGGGACLQSSVSMVANNTFVGNFSDADGGGLHVCVTCYPHAAPFVYDNVVTDNEIATDDPHHGAGGVGAAYLRGFGNNHLENNFRNGEPSEFGWFHELDEGYDAWVSDPSIADNWWGTPDPLRIAELVFDGVDAPELGIVSFEPPLTSPPTGPMPRVHLTSRKLKYVDAGDAMPAFLTIYNPGPELQVRLLLEDEGGTWAGELPFPGATRDDDAWLLTLPENSVFFEQVEDGTYDGSAGGGFFRSELQDTSGATLGVASHAPFDFAP